MTRIWGRAHGTFRHRPAWLRRESIFDPLPDDEIAANLRNFGYHAGLQLPPRTVARLRRHAEESLCRSGQAGNERFRIGDVQAGRLRSGKPVAVADVVDCAAADDVAGDPVLVETIRRCLGYMPNRAAIRLYWSPCSGLSDDERRWNGQTIDYHYDIERGQAVYVCFYLGDTDRRSGAHVLVAGSHGSKPLRFRLASTRQPEDVVLGCYGADRVVVLEGKAGFGFLEDPGCFHKVLPPTAAPRLMLQLRYS